MKQLVLALCLVGSVLIAPSATQMVSAAVTTTEPKDMPVSYLFSGPGQLRNDQRRRQLRWPPVLRLGRSRSRRDQPPGRPARTDSDHERLRPHAISRRDGQQPANAGARNHLRGHVPHPARRILGPSIRRPARRPEAPLRPIQRPHTQRRLLSGQHRDRRTGPSLPLHRPERSRKDSRPLHQQLPAAGNPVPLLSDQRQPDTRVAEVPCRLGSVVDVVRGGSTARLDKTRRLLKVEHASNRARGHPDSELQLGELRRRPSRRTHRTMNGQEFIVVTSHRLFEHMTPSLQRRCQLPDRAHADGGSPHSYQGFRETGMEHLWNVMKKGLLAGDTLR